MFRFSFQGCLALALLLLQAQAGAFPAASGLSPRGQRGTSQDENKFSWPPLNDELVSFARSLEATNDVSADLNVVLEQQVCEAACLAHEARSDAQGVLPDELRTNPEAVGDMVRCGKWLFLFGDFKNRLAMPEKFFSMLGRVFPEEVGAEFGGFGLLHADGLDLPVGMAEVSGTPWQLASPILGKPVAMTCAACHLGQMPDGRYAAGFPNEEFDLGKFNAYTLFSVWLADQKKEDTEVWPEEIQEHYRGMHATVKASDDSFARLLKHTVLLDKLRLTEWFLQIVNIFRPTRGELRSYLKGGPNQYYASSPALPMNKPPLYEDAEIFVSAPQIWDIYTVGQPNDRYYMSAMFPTTSLEHFIKGAFIVATGFADSSIRRYVEPLALYVATLRAPANPNPPPTELTAAGEMLFRQDCSSCHDLSIAGKSSAPVDPADVDMPEILLNPLTPNDPPHRSAREIQKILAEIGGIAVAPGAYSRPLSGIWSRTKLMHNGSVADLDAAFCITEARSLDRDPQDPRYDGVHVDLCTEHTLEERLALKAFLESL